MELEAGGADRFQGDLRQLLDAKKLQQVPEGKGLDNAKNTGEISLGGHQQSDATEMRNTTDVTRTLNATTLVSGQKVKDPRFELKESGQNHVTNVGNASTVNKDQTKFPSDIPTSIALARIYKVVGDQSSTIEPGHLQQVHDLPSAAAGESVDKTAGLRATVMADEGQYQVGGMALECADPTFSKASNTEAKHPQLLVGVEQPTFEIL